MIIHPSCGRHTPCIDVNISSHSLAANETMQSTVKMRRRKDSTVNALFPHKWALPFVPFPCQKTSSTETWDTPGDGRRPRRLILSAAGDQRSRQENSNRYTLQVQNCIAPDSQNMVSAIFARPHAANSNCTLCKYTTKDFDLTLTRE